MNNSSTLKTAKWMYLLLALGAFAGIGLEFVVIGLEYLVYGEFPDFQGPHWRLILHWIITCFAWSCSALFLVRNAKVKNGV